MFSSISHISRPVLLDPMSLPLPLSHYTMICHKKTPPNSIYVFFVHGWSSQFNFRPNWKLRIWSCCAEKHRPTLYAGKRFCPDALHAWSLVPTRRCVSLGEKHVEIRRYVGVCEKRAEMKTGGERFEIESTFICADILTAQIESYRIWHVFFSGVGSVWPPYL